MQYPPIYGTYSGNVMMESDKNMLAEPRHNDESSLKSRQCLRRLAKAIALRLGLDLRALACFRVALGALVVADVITRAPDLRAFYTDSGVLPGGIFLTEFANRLHISIHLANGTLVWQIFLFSLLGICGLALLVGYRTRLMTVVGWLLLISVHNRNPLVLNGGDVLLRMLLFWSIFLPLGAKWSVDATHSESRATPVRVAASNLLFSGGTMALTLQIFGMYFTAALLKDGEEWWPLGSASFLALSLDSYVTPIGVWMRQWHELLRYNTYAVYFLELIGPFLLFAPVFFVPLRMLAIFAFFCLHLNIDLTMRLGIFPWIDIAALIVLLPGECFDQLQCWILSRRRDAIGPRAVRYCRVFLLGVSKLLPRGKQPTASASNVCDLLALSFMVYVGLFLFQGFQATGIKIPRPWNKVAATLRLDQRWGLFAPFPLKLDGWFVIDGELSNGSRIDLVTKMEGQVSFDRPILMSYDRYQNARWRRYLLNIKSEPYKRHLPYFSKYLCSLWSSTSESDEKTLRRLEIFFMEEYTNAPGQEPTLTKRSIWQHDCSQRAESSNAIAGKE